MRVYLFHLDISYMYLINFFVFIFVEDQNISREKQ